MVLFNKFKYLVVVSAALILTACASTPKTDFDPSIDFSQYRTFQWEYAESNTKINDPVYDSPLFEKKLETAVSGLLLDRGFQGSADPDMTLKYHIADKERRHSPFYSVAVGYGRYTRNSHWSIFAPHFHSLRVDEVMIVVDVLDTKNRDLIWRGWTTTRKRSRPLSQGETVNLATKILAGFPPQ